MCLEKILDNDIRNLASKFYNERGQNPGTALEDWLKAKNIVYRRTIAGFTYLGIGIYLTYLLIGFFLTIYGVEILWCIGWSMIGIGASLINARNNCQSHFLHLVGYWSFVSLTISIVSFTVSLYLSKEDPSNLFIKFYSLSASVGLIGGFLGDTFRDLALKIINKKVLLTKSST